MATRNGQVDCVTALGETDQPAGWRVDKKDGGVLIDVASDEVISRGLSMPHSSRWYDGKLYLLHSGIRVPEENSRTWSNRFGGVAVTDADGKFILESLVAGWEYELDLEPRPDGTIPSLESVAVEPGQDADMGTMSIPTPLKPYVPPTLDERIARAMDVIGSAMERFERAIARCKLSKQKLLIVLGAADSPRLRRFMQLRYEDKDYREVRDDFLIMALGFP